MSERVQVGLRLDIDVWRHLKKRADKHGINFSALVRILLTNAVDETKYCWVKETLPELREVVRLEPKIIKRTRPEPTTEE